jgi:nicotinate-nucleotide pyrophosphorylase (carboxylating)
MLRADVMDLTVKLALREDIGRKDITTTALLGENLHIRAELEAKEAGILCGMEVAERVFRHVDENLRFLPVAKDGETLEAGREVAYIDGSARSILIAERTALNFVGHLSGIATMTHRFVEKVQGTKAKIMDTRKTMPNLRVLEKYAVVTGGGVNHRAGLYDQVLIKDNHLRILKDRSIPDIVRTVKETIQKNTAVGIEVKNLKELAEALKTEVNYILLDNMTPKTVLEAVEMRDVAGARRAVPLLEVSGGITLENVRSYAETGVERISIGALTHSAPWLDISLDIVE